jgi:hypothetical protein
MRLFELLNHGMKVQIEGITALLYQKDRIPNSCPLHP